MRPASARTSAGAGRDAHSPPRQPQQPSHLPGEASLVLPAAGFMRALVGIAVVLVLLHLVVVWSYHTGWKMPLGGRFYLDAEANLPTFFSTFLLLTSAGLLAAIAAGARARREKYTRHWGALALIFFLMAVDEAASLHEVLIDPLRDAFDLSGLLRFSWVLAGLVAVAAFSLAYLRFLLSLPRRLGLLFAASAALYVTGAIGLEMIGGSFFVEEGARQGANLLPYMLAATLEETLEMTGILLFVHTLLTHLRDTLPRISLQVA